MHGDGSSEVCLGLYDQNLSLFVLRPAFSFECEMTSKEHLVVAVSTLEFLLVNTHVVFPQIQRQFARKLTPNNVASAKRRQRLLQDIQPN